jgi:hypothetical protein
MTKMLAGAAALAGFTAAAPAAAQYYPYGYSAYGAANPYAYGYNSYGYNSYAVNPQLATQQCTAAVQNRLYNRANLATIIGSLVGIPMNQSRVVAVTSMTQTRSGFVRVRGLASTGRYGYNGYSPYGVGAYGSLGYNTAASADLSFKCDVDARGYVRDLDINRRY